MPAHPNAVVYNGPKCENLESATSALPCGAEYSDGVPHAAALMCSGDEVCAYNKLLSDSIQKLQPHSKRMASSVLCRQVLDLSQEPDSVL